MDDALYRLHAEREETYWWWVAKNRIILSLVTRFAPRAGSTRRRALDVGCGAGAVLARLSQSFDAVGVDMSPLALDYCRARGLNVLQGSLPDELPFSPEPSGGPFHVIVASEVIEHVPDDAPSVVALARLLHPGGILVCTVPAHRWLWSSHDDFNHHKRRYSRRDFASLFTSLPVTPIVCSQYQCASMPLLLAARIGERVSMALGRRPPEEPNVRPLPAPVNTVLRAAFEAEKYWLPYARLPWGSSVITVHRRTGAEH